MIAVLTFVDGFGHDTEVEAIYPTLEIAKQQIGRTFKYTEFDFGRVQFDVYDCKTCYLPDRKNKKKRG